ncbi:MAG: hypothetical protein ABI960_00460 [Candidatus Eisenbacteria bacterium]
MIRFRRATLLLALWFFAPLLFAPAAQAAVPSTMSYQGRLTDGVGIDVPDGAYALTFRLYDAVTGGALLWTETQANVTVTGGLFSIVLGSTTPLAVPFDRQYWLGVAVAADPEMTPRSPLTSVPYAMATRTPLPGIAHLLYAGSYSVIGNGNFGNPINLFKDQTLDFTAPADGYVVLSATGYLTMTLVTAGTSQYGIIQISETTANATTTVPAEYGYYQWIGFQFAPNNGYWDWSFGIQRVFPVTAGAHKYSFCSARYGAYSPTQESITFLSLLATYYPTSYGTVVTAPGGLPTASHPSPEASAR